MPLFFKQGVRFNIYLKLGIGNTMEKLYYEGELYYINKGKVYDEHFLEVSLEISKKLLSEYYMHIDYKQLDEQALISFIKEIKNSEQYGFCIDCIIYGLGKFINSKNYYLIVFPILTSCYRAMGQSQKAIDFYIENKNLFDYAISVPLLTSLAAAYCDVGNYKEARAIANKAYVMQGGSTNHKTELSLVYMRIKKESNDNY